MFDLFASGIFWGCLNLEFDFVSLLSRLWNLAVRAFLGFSVFWGVVNLVVSGWNCEVFGFGISQFFL